MTSQHIMGLILAEDLDGAESARESAARLVKSEAQLRWFLAQYQTLKTWAQRSCFVLVFQDTLLPSLRPIMRHTLDTPDTRDDTAHEVRAIALCHLEERLDRFMEYFSDQGAARAALKRHRQTPDPYTY